MQVTTNHVTPKAAPNPALFDTTLEEQLLLSVHLLGKPTVKQLHRLHQDDTRHRGIQELVKGLSGRRSYLKVIKPLDIEKPQHPLPYVYLDTRLSRRLIEQRFGVQYRRVPPTPSRDWRFLRHDVMLIDELISFERTAQHHSFHYGYQSHFDDNGDPLYPVVSVSDGELVHRLRPQPDKTIIVGGYHLPLEFDCGEEQISLGNIIRDSSIVRKFLVYDSVERSGALDRLGWGKRIYPFVVTTRKGSVKSARKRIRSMIAAIPESVNPAQFYFIDRETHQAAGDDVAATPWLRGDGREVYLPPFMRL